MHDRWNWFLENIVLLLLGARWIGHGRAVESLFTIIALTYGIALLVDSNVLLYSQATVDLVWWHSGNLIVASALLIKAGLSGSGLIANINAWPYSRALRFTGALIGSMIWVWYLSKYSLAGTPVNLGAIFSVWAFVYSIRIMAMALANLPRPGEAAQL